MIFGFIPFAADAEATPSTPASLNIFSQPNPWTLDVSSMPASSQSNAIIQGLSAAGGWGQGNQLRIDFSITVMSVDASTPIFAFQPTDNWYFPDCDRSPLPIPPGGSLEGESGYQCTQGGDCHLLLVDNLRDTLYEVWTADIPAGSTTVSGGCMALWNLSATYNTGRGLDCTSADAGGFPISALLFSPDEISAGLINHAIRFILPNSRIQKGKYVLPATHTTNAATGGSNLPPYGTRLRLKSSFNVSRLSGGAKVIAKALQTYGMLLSDGGNMALTAVSDLYTTKKWADVGVDSFSLTSIQVTDFEVVDMGQLITYNSNCNRQSITQTSLQVAGNSGAGGSSSVSSSPTSVKSRANKCQTAIWYLLVAIVAILEVHQKPFQEQQKMMAQVSTSYKLHSADALVLDQNIPIPAPQKPLAAAAEPGSPQLEEALSANIMIPATKTESEPRKSIERSETLPHLFDFEQLEQDFEMAKASMGFKENTRVRTLSMYSNHEEQVELRRIFE
ncbi:hypothetical protein HDV06_004213 [Boothiomyces sp. JEL0866]|nr:hypothetical protein HDV06_004213 [Boothiomyces sp. JEL0866]